jgi:hypothetical protein
MTEVDEDELLSACRAGRVLDCADGSARRPINAELLRRCCLQHREQVDARGVRLRNAAVVGALDLSGIEVSFPLSFECCHFEGPLLLEGAQLHSLALTGCPRINLLACSEGQARRSF